MHFFLAGNVDKLFAIYCQSLIAQKKHWNNPMLFLVPGIRRFEWPASLSNPRYAPIPFTSLYSLDFFRAALFLWYTPLVQALSIWETACFSAKDASSFWPALTAAMTFFMAVLVLDFIILFLKVFFSITLILFLADLILAKISPPQPIHFTRAQYKSQHAPKEIVGEKPQCANWQCFLGAWISMDEKP
jgi:hypothetical protein